MSDTSFDTNPAQQRETQGNTGSGRSAYLCRFCDYEQRSETQCLRLRIRRSQVRVLPTEGLAPPNGYRKNRLPPNDGSPAWRSAAGTN
jgi:hypothetical protein